jgi:hypothetical protein
LLLQDVHRSIAKFFKANLVDTATRVGVASGHTDGAQLFRKSRIAKTFSREQTSRGARGKTRPGRVNVAHNSI